MEPSVSISKSTRSGATNPVYLHKYYKSSQQHKLTIDLLHMNFILYVSIAVTTVTRQAITNVLFFFIHVIQIRTTAL
ncbi:unnamed protein product [Rotaria sordida]|uniref:Uncharacterized protein n=1 Tax=Rotaria sordida TaxID=392033 RepID=A0A819HQC7_9BILA|nr:unnamed protein product [Rotaria sordida]CAF3904710.1 unnamed protein product [Rotaria sordida]CAF3921926.1 unnamed protein product [Rotaria sordida]